MKKRTLRSLIGMCTIFLMIGLVASINSNHLKEQSLTIEFARPQDEIKYLPIETTLKPYSEEFWNVNSINDKSQDTVEYNIITGIETQIAIEPNDLITTITQLEPHEGWFHNNDRWHNNPSADSFVSALHTSHVFPPDDRVLVSDTTIYPYSSIVKIWVEAANGSYYVGSGAIIDPNHVLTCGHIAYIHDAGGWVSEMEITPGLDGTTEPYGVAYATLMRSTTGWINDESYQHDWAVITLDRDIGDSTGWMGVKTLPLDHINYTDQNYLYTAGYPAEIKSGYYMWETHDDEANEATEYNIWYHLDSEGGQSGSAVWTYDEGDPYILGVHAYSQLGTGPNFGTRLNTDKFNLLVSWLAQDASSEQKTDLQVTGSNNIIAAIGSPYVYKLSTRINVLTSIQNIGLITADKVTIGFYFSSDTNITTEDYYIGKVNIYNVQPMDTVNAQFLKLAPLNIPVGTYKIGWIIDPNNELDEYNKENNVYVGPTLYVRSSVISDILEDPLWVTIIIAAVIIIIVVPTVIEIARKRKRKRLAMGLR
ncbi:MAG: hypothetical protein JW776_11925 [Candidatus Lokiarchaeota archaeon]|nr:hypothetical protein [Candidatus Lokiarchaeota archaeon]